MQRKAATSRIVAAFFSGLHQQPPPFRQHLLVFDLLAQFLHRLFVQAVHLQQHAQVADEVEVIGAVVADDLRAVDIIPHGVMVELQQVEFDEVEAGFQLIETVCHSKPSLPHLIQGQAQHRQVR